MGNSSQDTLGVCPGARRPQNAKRGGAPEKVPRPAAFLRVFDVLREGPVEPQALATDRCRYARRRQRGGASLTPAFATPNIPSFV